MSDKHLFTNSDLSKSDQAKKEEEILEFWQKEKIFEKSVEKEAPQGEFVFYEGPPTSNGRPGIHHVEARSFKDAIPRYKTMQGYRVKRKAGWDTHGLPVELQVEKQLGLKSKKEVESYGIAEFNKKCRESVWEYLKEWNALTTRIGYWVDQENPYITYHNEYIESLWSIITKIYNDGNIIRDYKIVPWCSRCGTGLSSHELAQGYEDDTDLSVTVKFELEDEPGTFILAWTTTPWTLPGNVALAVGEEIEYVKVLNKDGEKLIIAKNRKDSLFPEKIEVVESLKGFDLVGKKYKPVFPFLKEIMEQKKIDGREKAFTVYSADFVTTDDGTGVVHTAVMYGQDDFELGTKIGLPKFHIVKEDGNFIDDLGFLSGLFVKNEETDIAIIKDLANQNLLFSKAKYKHSYPHCWRCKTPLIYYARDSWYITMSKFSDQLLSENEKINWEPENIKNGRFGEWLKGIKDWAISRERYWGTPIPIWQKQDGNYVSIGSISELKNYIKKSNNTYVVIRHGEAFSNIDEVINSVFDEANKLTAKGISQVLESAKELKLAYDNFDYIYYSPLERTKETAEIIAKEFLIKNDCLLMDERVTENKAGIFEGKKWKELHNFYVNNQDGWLLAKPEGGESHLEIKQRAGSFLYDLEKTYQNKKILIVTHGGFARMLGQIVLGNSLENEKYLSTKEAKNPLLEGYQNAEWRQLDFVPVPHDENYSLDLHRPYIDNIKLVDENGAEMFRVKEIIDVWFDSGAMPFAQHHYPFENKEYVEKYAYPADFISEAIDQTRGWFYTLLAVGVLMGVGTPYKNVICLGHILDSNGKKMSKSLGNIVSPWDMIEKYGADTVRFWMYSVNQPGESKNFDEKTLSETSRKVFRMLDNILSFYQMYGSGNATNLKPESSPNVLDQWILAKLKELIILVTKSLDRFDLLTSTRAIRDFIAELSQWYLRRSRDRFKGEIDEDQLYAEEVMKMVLLETAKILAPFTPFYAEKLYKELKGERESVHLENWPQQENFNQEILNNMETVRSLISRALEKRSTAGIKVRQPLATLFVDTQIKEEFHYLILDEVNVQEIKFSNELSLDLEITPELKLLGDIREFLRNLQTLRKDLGLQPLQKIKLTIVDSSDIVNSILANNTWQIPSGVIAIEKVSQIDQDNSSIIEIDAEKIIVSIEVVN